MATIVTLNIRITINGFQIITSKTMLLQDLTIVGVTALELTYDFTPLDPNVPSYCVCVSR